MTDTRSHPVLWKRLKALDKKGDEWFDLRAPHWLKLVYSAFKPKGFVHGIGLIALWLLAIAFITFVICAIVAAQNGVFFKFLSEFKTLLI